MRVFTNLAPERWYSRRGACPGTPVLSRSDPAVAAPSPSFCRRPSSGAHPGLRSLLTQGSQLEPWRGRPTLPSHLYPCSKGLCTPDLSLHRGVLAVLLLCPSILLGPGKKRRYVYLRWREYSVKIPPLGFGLIPSSAGSLPQDYQCDSNPPPRPKKVKWEDYRSSYMGDHQRQVTN